MAGRWTLRLLGGLEARNGDVLLTHFVSQPIAGLLALLALEPQRSHPREALIERLWPGVALEVGRNRLRNAISTLRRLIEPPGVPSGSVLVADRQSVRLAPNATTCDALEFEQAVRAGQFAKARALYRGELLPGFYDDWVQDERARLVALHDRISDALPEPAAHTTPLETGAEPPDWSTAKPTLPSYLTSYFGREDERQRLLALVAAHRLVTLSGAGGCGKTRLAVEVARAAGGFDCVAFAALAECSNAEQLAEQLRVALQLPKASGDALDQAVAMLRDQPTLLVLDNFEQLVQAGGVPVVEALLTRVPALHLLVTSRRVLGLSGEHDFALQPLPQPALQDTAEQAARSPSVSLFVDRARSARPDFQVTARNVEALVALCRALEGLPLAIELAASRSRAFSPAEMHAALSQRFELLERGGRRGTRHGSLRVAIDWSWRLLSPSQQAFLLTLSVFRGGWSAMSAQAVSDESRARDVLEALTADSLLRSESDADGDTRFSMLDMIREYLRDKLEPAEAQRLRRRHRAHFLAQGMALGERGHAAPRDEMPNFIEALQTAVDDAEPALALALGVALRGEWQLHGMPQQVQALLERALAPQADSARTEASSSAAMRVHAHVLLRNAAMSAARGAAAELHATQALLLAGTQPALRAEALLAQAQQHWDGSRDTEAMRPLLAEALVLARREGALETEAGALSVLSSITLTDGANSAEAFELCGQAQRLYERAGIEHLANRMLFSQANCLTKLYRHQEALALLEECERRFVASGHVAALPELANAQGFLYSYMVRWHDGELAFARCAVGAAKQQNRYLMCLGMWNLARPLAHRRKPDAAARLLAFAARYWVQSFGPLTDNDQLYIRQVRRLARVQVGDAAFERAWRQGEQMTLAAALDLAALSLLPAPAG